MSFKDHARGMLIQDYYKFDLGSKMKHPAFSKRSKSVIAVIQSPSNIERQKRQTKSNYIAKSTLKFKQYRSQTLEETPYRWPQEKNINITHHYRFKDLLNPQITHQRKQKYRLPIQSSNDLTDLAKSNPVVKAAMMRTTEEKRKMDKLMLSHKYSQSQKKVYFCKKEEEVGDLIENQIEGLYEEYFKEQYEKRFFENSKQKFMGKLEDLMKELSSRVKKS